MHEGHPRVLAEPQIVDAILFVFVPEAYVIGAAVAVVIFDDGIAHVAGAA